MEKLYFEDLETLKASKATLETPLSPSPITVSCIQEYIEITSDHHASHSDSRYNLRFGYMDIFVPGFLMPGLAEGFFRRYHEYALHMNRGFSAKPIIPLYPGNHIRVVDEILQTKSHPRLVVDNSSPVSIRRKVFNENQDLVYILELDYLVSRRQ